MVVPTIWLCMKSSGSEECAPRWAILTKGQRGDSEVYKGLGWLKRRSWRKQRLADLCSQDCVAPDALVWGAGRSPAGLAACGCRLALEFSFSFQQFRGATLRWADEGVCPYTCFFAAVRRFAPPVFAVINCQASNRCSCNSSSSISPNSIPIQPFTPT